MAELYSFINDESYSSSFEGASIFVVGAVSGKSEKVDYFKFLIEDEYGMSLQKLPSEKMRIKVHEGGFTPYMEEITKTYYQKTGDKCYFFWGKTRERLSQWDWYKETIYVAHIPEGSIEYDYNVSLN